MEKCKHCQKEFKKLVAWWVIENNQNFKLCQPCSDKENKRIWDESLQKYKLENPSEEKEKMEIDYWKAFFFLTSISLFVILIVLLNKAKWN